MSNVNMLSKFELDLYLCKNSALTAYLYFWCENVTNIHPSIPPFIQTFILM